MPKPLFILLFISVLLAVMYTIFLQVEKNKKEPFLYVDYYDVIGGCFDICDGDKKELYCTEEFGYKTCYGECSVPVYNNCDPK